MGQLKIKQTRSVIDRPKKQKRTIEALGLGRPNWEVVHNDTPQIRGMINKVSHLLEVSEVKETSKVSKKKSAALKKKKEAPAAEEVKTED
jgi:large subunit ribosomal protein L30